MTRTVLDMEVEGVRPRQSPKLRYILETIRRDMKKNGLTDVNILDSNDWHIPGDLLTWKSLQASRFEVENVVKHYNN